MKYRLLPLLSFFALFIVLENACADKTRIALCDLSAQDVDQATAVAVSERLAAWLGEKPVFEVTAPSRVYVLLKERGFTKSCRDDDTACLSEMGKVLGVDVVIAGIFAKAKDYYTILLRVVDVSTGRVITTGYQDVNYPVEKILTDWTAMAAGQLETVIATRLSKFGMLKIRSVPRGAKVVVGGKEVGKTDFTMEKCIPGKYGLALSLATFADIRDTVTVEPEKARDVSYTLVHTKAYADSMHAAGRKKTMLRYVSGGLGLVCAGAGVLYSTRAQDAVREERDAKNRYLTARPGSDFSSLYGQYQDAGKKTDNAMLARNIFYGLTGACVAGFTLTFVF
jgi:hypothetical protein